MRKLSLRFAAIVMAMTIVSPGHAQDAIASFYRGKTLRVINPFAEPGIYATIAQLIAIYLPRHLPGAPLARAEFMPGGGGLQGANYLYNAAERDGSAIGVLYDNMPTAQALALDNLVKFDARRFSVLGSINRGETGLVAILKRAGVATLEAAKEKPLVLGSTGTSSAQYIVPDAMNRMMGTKFKLIPGYKTVMDVFLAMENGEADGIFTNYATIIESRPQWITEQRFNWLAQLADQVDPNFPTAPLLQDVAGDPKQAEVFRFLAMSRAPGKIILAPPNVPHDRLAALQTAFADTMRDPEFISMITKANLAVAPRDAKEALDVIRETVEVDTDTLKRVRDLMNVAK